MARSYPNSDIKILKNHYPIASLQSFSKRAGVAVFLIGCLVTIGWMFNITLFKSILPGLVTMKANTAICFILAGGSLWLLHQQLVVHQTGFDGSKPGELLSRGAGGKEKIDPLTHQNFLGKLLGQSKKAIGKTKSFSFLGFSQAHRQSLLTLLPSLAIAISLLTLIQYSFKINLGIDQLFFKETENAVRTFAPGRMAPNTAGNFVLLGSAILLLTKKVYRAAQCLSLMGFLVAFLGLLGYLYGITAFYAFGRYTAMGLHTSIAFILLAVGILFANPNRGLMAEIASTLAGGIMARRLFLAAIAIPPLLCWLVLTGERLHLYSSEVGIALLAILNVIVLCTLIWWNARTFGAIDYQALHDPLTGLPNRIMFNKLLSASLANARRRQGSLAVLFLDLDRFKKINDILGHAVGDQLLKAAAIRLTNCIGKSDAIARWGGDEFTLLLPQIGTGEYTAVVARRILDALKPPFLLGNHYLHISTSIGIALYPTDGEDPDMLIKNADVALYSAKESGRNNYQFYTPTINDQAPELLVLENRLHYAWERGEFFIYYQPKVNINTGRITGMEALLRWRSRELGFVSPGKFIRIAEESGLIVPIGEWVLRTACAQNKVWLDAGLSPTRVAVNLSVRQFQQPNLVEMVARVLAETKLDPWFLELEITETIAMQNVDFSKAILSQLNEMGVHISMDDFGTGYSSLSYLKQFPLHTLKVDKSFVSDITSDSCNEAIASAVIALGHGLSMNVVAEGVETKEQLECLQKLGCEEMQGFFFSQPLPDREATALLRKHQSFCWF